MYAPGSSGGSNGGPPRVLIADDNPVNRRVVGKVLSRGGYRVDRASDGAEAVRRHGQVEYDLILMDCFMPGLDGFAATRAIRQAEAAGFSARRTPIVALTASDASEDRARCARSGMDDIVYKPFHTEALLAVVARWISGVDAEAEAERAVSTALDIVQDGEDDEDDAFAVELITSFLDETPGMLRELREAIATGDAAVAHRQAHTLKSSAAMLGARRLAAACAILEPLLAAGAPAASVADGVAEVERAWEEGRRLLVAERVRRGGGVPSPAAG